MNLLTCFEIMGIKNKDLAILCNCISVLKITDLSSLVKKKTRCRPSKGRRCIPDVVLKNEGSMVQTFQNINVHAVNTDIC